ncbi:hypothetical protein NDA13_005086 [Ustilago tritici]|nr:hypothetical protein NDA13_005086 [Ustilago tritici]
MTTQPSPPPPVAGGSSAPLAPNPSSSSSTTTTQPPLRPPTQSQNAGPHLLSLKVMRASAPSLAVSEKPYYDSHLPSSSPLIAAVGKGISESLSSDPLSNHYPDAPSSNFPISNLLTLPSSFGTLYLGETFRTYLCVRNESPTSPVREPSLRAEMQVGSSETEGRWHQLAHLILPSPTSTTESGEPVWELPPSAPLETSLGYDIKDLGPHVLVCTVGYKALSAEGGWVERSFRKFYKFSVDRSPISVRTKVHQPRNAASLYHADEGVRKRVELEVQVQNASANGMGLVFEGLSLRPADGWRWDSVDRPSLTPNSTKGESVEEARDMWLKPNNGGNEALADGDIRQYLFTLHPKPGVKLGGGVDLGKSVEGHLIRGDALGNLDIGWRMSLGEPGRLQTSQLVRRRVVPLPVVLPSGTSSSPRAKLKTELMVLPDALEALRKITPGGQVELGVKVRLSDVCGSDLPPPPQKGSEGERGEIEGETKVDGDEVDEDDDDTPLSQIAASSPRASRCNTSTCLAVSSNNEDLEPITIRRTLKVALQHCSILPPPPPNPFPSIEQDVGGASTPRKPPLRAGSASRTSTATPAVIDKAKSRLQANLSNLVRGSSLSLRGRGSMDIASDDASSGTGISRGGTPQPPAVPPKTLAPAAIIAEPQQEKERVEYPEPTLSWSRVQELYLEWLQGNAQAITRPAGPVSVPDRFLPTPHLVRFEGGSLVKLPEIGVEVKVLRSRSNGLLYRTEQDGEGAEGEVEGKLKFAVADNVDEEKMGRVVRFGALRVLLLGYKEQGGGEQERECAKTLLELPVFAEAVLPPY